MTRALFTILTAATLSLLLISIGGACVICVPYPTRTLTDRLLEYEHLVFARELPDSPYSFDAIETLAGSSPVTPVKTFVSSATRRKLQHYPHSAVLLGQNDDETEYRFIAFADTAYQGFIRALLDDAKSWSGPGGSEQRIDFFSRFLTSPHPGIREQAYLEVGRAPYYAIKDIAPTIPREQVREFLTNWRMIEWHNLYILILGQSPHADDKALIRHHIDQYARSGLSPNLSAWLIAFIEANPDSGLDEFEAIFLDGSNRSAGEQDQVFTALSVLGSLPDNPVLRKRIIASYGRILTYHPALAGRVASDLAAWRVQALVDQLQHISDSGTIGDSGSQLMLDYYLSAAPGFVVIP